MENKQSTELTELQPSYFSQYGQVASQSPMTGTMLKFSKGDWLLGPDEETIDNGEKFTAVMDDLMVGWIKWVDGRPEQQIMGKVSEGYQPPRRKELGDDDESLWDVDTNDKPRDPWQFSNHLVLRKVGSDGTDDEDLYTFATSSRGGINAIGELCKAYGKAMRQKPDDYPIIELGVDSYVHPNKEFGRIKIPLLKLVDWEGKTPAKKAPKASKTTTKTRNKK